jgi:hypothetical protein
MRFTLLALACVFGALVVPLSAASAERMLVGFQDDPSFRWREDRQSVLDQAQRIGAGIVRTTVYWSRIAQTRPANATNPFDPAYRFDDLDELVRQSEMRGMEVMLTIWGTPSWANGGKGQNFAPTNFADLQNFARALGGRYSGRFAGYPFVRYYTVWNESNLGQFLSPQYNTKGKPVAPGIYARIYRAAYAGIKAGSRRALVGIGETSARGRDKVTSRRGQQQTESPGKFAELLAKERPVLRFDAWSHHPYPVSPNLPPTARVRWPNVGLTQLERFEDALGTWFGRRNIPIWITEYAHETRPGEPRGVTYAQQATYARTALRIAQDDPQVKMFIWFILRDDPTSTWQSGLIERDDQRKPAFATFSAMAKLLDARNPALHVRSGIRNPLVRVPVLEIYARSGPGTRVGVTMSLYDNNRSLGTTQPTTTVETDGWISLRLPVTTVRGHFYRAYLKIADVHNNIVSRLVTLAVLR